MIRTQNMPADQRAELYKEVMRLRPVKWGQRGYKPKHLSPGRVAEMFDMSRATVVYWWNGGGRPGSKRGLRTDGKCRNGHQRTSANTKRHASGRRECLDCYQMRMAIKRGTVSSQARGATAKEAYALMKRGEYQARHEFHPKWNPDPAVAPLTSLWVRADEVLELLRRSYDDHELFMLYHERQGEHIVYEMRAGKREWVRLDAADAILTEAGLTLHMLPTDPVYSGGKAPC